MKLLHIIDGDYFALMERTITDVIGALSAAGARQTALSDGQGKLPLPATAFGTQLGIMDSWLNRFKSANVVKQYQPDAVIRWGEKARELRVNGTFMDITFASQLDDFKNFDRATTVMANDEATLRAARVHGFSGLKSFVLPPFFTDYKGKISRGELFILERAPIVFAAGLFAKGAGWEDLFDAFAVLRETYFIIQGQGDLELIKELSAKAGVKSRCRFVPDFTKTAALMKLASFAALTPKNPEFAKFALAAARAGIPVLASEGREAEEFIEDGKSGFLVKSKDTYLLKKKLKQIDETDGWEREKIAGALDEATGMFDDARAAECIMSAIATKK